MVLYSDVINRLILSHFCIEADGIEAEKYFTVQSSLYLLCTKERKSLFIVKKKKENVFAPSP